MMRQDCHESRKPSTLFAAVLRSAALIGVCLVLVACQGRDAIGPKGQPAITSLTPSAGMQGATIQVSIGGKNFLPGATVAVGGSGVTVSNVAVATDGTAITATFTIGTTAALGPRMVTVTTGSIRISGAQTFTVNAPPPTLTGIAPASAAQGDTVNVSLTGTNFISGSSVAVTGGGMNVENVTVVSATRITAKFTITGYATPGARNVTVKTTSGMSDAQTFTVNWATPTLTEIFPKGGVPAGTLSVSLAGSGFIPGSSVLVGGSGVSVSDVAVVSRTTITATFTVASTARLGTDSVRVRTAGGTSPAQAFLVTASEAYVAVVGGGVGVGVIDAGSGTLIGKVSVTDPTRIAFTPDGKSACITSSKTDSIYVIDVATDAVTRTISVRGAPQGVAVTPNGTQAYVAIPDSNSVSVIDVETGAVTGEISVGPMPTAVAFRPDGTQAYVTNMGDPGTISVIDVATGTLTKTISVGRDPYGIAFTPDGSQAYVTQYIGATSSPDYVSVINAATGTVASGIMVGSSPSAVAFAPDGTQAYVTNLESNTVSVIDVATGTVTKTISVGTEPFDVAFTPDGKMAYVTDYGGNGVSLIDVATGVVTKGIFLGGKPYGIAIR